MIKKYSVTLINNLQRFYTTNTLPASVTIVEVGPRDGLQNEAQVIPTPNKVELIKKLHYAGLKRIESGSFVSPLAIPQMADTAEIFYELNKSSSSSSSSSSFSALTPNMKGLELAIECGVKEVAVFGSASETFSQKNINCSIEESIKKFEIVTNEAINNHGIKVRGYISCVLGCPYEGHVDPEKVAILTKKLLDIGCYEVSLGDTTGIGNPTSTAQLIDCILQYVDSKKIAVHFHDTYGMSIANIMVALEKGIEVIDSSVSGLGGCPYAQGASGNVATEDVVYLLDSLGINHGVDLDRLRDAQEYIDGILNRTSVSKVVTALEGKDRRGSGGSNGETRTCA